MEMRENKGLRSLSVPYIPCTLGWVSHYDRLMTCRVVCCGTEMTCHVSVVVCLMVHFRFCLIFETSNSTYRIACINTPSSFFLRKHIFVIKYFAPRSY